MSLNAALLPEFDQEMEFRRSALNQVIHHRAQLVVYLRLLDVPVPGLYGQSADEREQG